MRETWVRSLSQEDPLEKEMATHSSTLAWRTPRMEEPGGPQSMGSQGRTRLSNFTFNSLNTSSAFLQNRLYTWSFLSIFPISPQTHSCMPQPSPPNQRILCSNHSLVFSLNIPLLDFPYKKQVHWILHHSIWLVSFRDFITICNYICFYFLLLTFLIICPSSQLKDHVSRYIFKAEYSTWHIIYSKWMVKVQLNEQMWNRDKCEREAERML